MTHVLVLTADAGVSDRAVTNACREMSAHGVEMAEPVRLGSGAVEIEISQPLPGDVDFDEIVADTDANVVPMRVRRKRLLIADMDSTIIGVECIDELADYAGVKAEVAAITEAAMRGVVDFEAALVARVELLRGLPVAVLKECYDERVRLNPGTLVLVRTMAATGALTALVSGGFTYFAERVAGEAGFAHHQANVLEVMDGRLSGRIDGPILGRAAKLAALRRLAMDEAINLENTVAVGDGANDLAMITAAGLGVAYRAKPAVAAAADARLSHSDLSAVLVLQGIPKDEWCT